MSQETDFDVVVVGSGPGGATSARIAAKRGLRVLLVDKKQELGVPIQCSGAVSARALHDTGVIPSEEFISTSIYGFVIYDAAGNATTQDYRILKPERYHNTPLGYVVDRRRFDRYLMTQAERAGVEVWLKTEAVGYAIQTDGIAKIRLNRFGQSITVCARVIVGADGLQSQVAKWANLHPHVRLGELASCLQLVVDGVTTNGLLEIVTGHQWAPGGYAWLFPKGYGYAEVGLGVIRTMTDKDARWHLDNFMRHSFMAQRLKDCRVLEVQGGGVPLAAPLKKPYADHVILVGDAARHVNPITGGGIHIALQDGIIAGNFLGDFLSTGELPTAARLAGYQQYWYDELGHAMQKLYAIKTDIFCEKNLTRRDQKLYEFLAGYFHPSSEFRRV